ncbi:MAG TPA: guanine deaminase [Candidatus Binatia bacterium]
MLVDPRFEPVIYRGRIVNPRLDGSCEEFRHGCLVVGGDGRIIDCGCWEDVKRRLDFTARVPVVDFGSQLLLPGFVDLHLHFPQFDCRGMYADSLLTWLKKHIYPVEARFSDSNLARNTAKRLLHELASCGTTTAVIFSSVHAEATDILFEEAANSGLRAIIGKVLMDEGGEVPRSLLQEWRIGIEESIALCKKWHGASDGRLYYAFSPRFAVTCSEQLMITAGTAAREYGAYIQTHVSETLEEVDFVRKRFPHRRNYVDVYNSAGLLGERTILAHAIHFEDDEFKIVGESGAKVAYCPSSNFFLKSGTMNLRKMHQNRITVGLGSDIGAAPSASLLSVMRDGIYMQPQWVQPREMLAMATIRGATALGLDERIGSLEQGKDADFIVADPSPLSGRWREIEGDLDDVLSLMVFRDIGQVVARAFVKGEEVYRGISAGFEDCAIQ